MIEIIIGSEIANGNCALVRTSAPSQSDGKAEKHVVCLLDVLGMSEATTQPPEKVDEQEHLEKLYWTMKRVFNEIRDFLEAKSKFDGKPISVGHYIGQSIIDDEEFKKTNGLDLDYYKEQYRKILKSMCFFSDTNLFYLKLDEEEKNRVVQMIAFSDIAKMYLKLCALYPGKKEDTYHLVLRGGIAAGILRDGWSEFDIHRHSDCECSCSREQYKLDGHRI